MSSKITVIHSVFIKASPTEVWDFTQDYSQRTKWDKSIIEATVKSEEPKRIVKVYDKRGLSTYLRYRQYDRPNKTSLVMTNTRSSFIKGGGGSWKYLNRDGGTLWTQTNTLILKKNTLLFLLRPFIVLKLKQSTRTAMERAKQIIENKQSES